MAVKSIITESSDEPIESNKNDAQRVRIARRLRRAALGINKLVYVPNVVRPVDTMEILAAEHDANISGRVALRG